MSAQAINMTNENTDWVETADRLAKEFSARAAEHDEEGSFVQQNYDDLRDDKLFSASIPSELGGGGASYDDICRIIRILGSQCSSTGLTFAMHSHPVAANIFKYLNGDEKAKGALTKIAANELIIAGTA